jgi:hypothetical protein
VLELLASYELRQAGQWHESCQTITTRSHAPLVGSDHKGHQGSTVNAEQWSAGQAALYSLDRLVPAVRLIDPDKVPKRTRAQQAWSVVQQFLGWLLTLFIVGWLGSLLVQP